MIETNGIIAPPKDTFALCDNYLMAVARLRADQHEARQIILNNTVTILHGNAGSGKTLAAVYTALELFFHKHLQIKTSCCIDNIVVCVPIADNDELGFLRGTLSEKLEPRVAAVKAMVKKLCPIKDFTTSINRALNYYAISHIRGLTFENSIVIIDEAQNATHSQIKLILSRLGKNSKLVICGDENQIDLKDPSLTGLPFLKNLNGQIDGFACYEMKENNRHPIVKDFLYHYSF